MVNKDSGLSRRNAQNPMFLRITMVMSVSRYESHCHPQIDFRDGYENRGVSHADHLVNSEESFIMTFKCICKDGYQALADTIQCVT